MKNNTIKRLVLVMLMYPITSFAAIITYDNEAAFLGAIGSSTTYDFEESSGFPPSGGVIDLFDGVNFDAKTITSASSTSGTQSMTGSGAGAGTFTSAIVTPGPTTGFGFFALDLTTSSNEVIKAIVDFEFGPDQIFNVGLGGLSNFTPIYFGVIDSTDNILQVTFSGTDDSGVARAWLIDDLTIGTSVPEPSTLALLGLGLLGLGLKRRRQLKV